MSDVIICQKVSKSYQLRASVAKDKTRRSRWRNATETFWALRDIDMRIKQGQIVGIVGQNGSGKSTLLKVLSRITYPTSGRFGIRGRIASLLEVGTGFHPELSGRENIYLSGMLLGMTRGEIRRTFDQIVDFSGIEPFIDTPVKRYSSGMRVRLGFSVAAHLRSDVLLVDEVLAVGDLAFQDKCLRSIEGLQASGRTILFVSHQTAAMRSICDAGVVLSEGRLSFSGSIEAALEEYRSSLRSALVKPLSRRSDRVGNGPFRVRAVRSDPSIGEGKLLADVEWINPSTSMRKEYDLKFAFLICDQYGQRLCTLYNEFAGNRLSASDGKFTVACRYPTLPLVAGRYPVDIWIEVDGQISDGLKYAFELDQPQTAVRASGRMPVASKHGPILWESSFKLVRSDS